MTSYQIKEAPMLTKEIDGSLLSSYTHLRVQAFASPQDTPLEICIDPGTSRSFIDRKFLKTLEHNVEPRRGAARGIGGREKTSEWATFSFYLLGKDSSNTPTFMRITKAAWVMDDLSPTMLLGNDALAPYGANIHYDARTVDFTSLDLKIPFDIDVRATSCTRKVTTTREIVLLPGQQAHIPVEYKPLPNDRSFAFEAKHGAMVNSIINAKTPKVVLVVNQSNGTLRIPKNTHAGTIKENIESGYFATSWDKACKAIGVAWMIGAATGLTAAASATAMVPAPGTNLSHSVSPSPAIASEFPLSDMVRCIADGTYVPSVPSVSSGSAPSSAQQPPAQPSSTPLSDLVFQLSQSPSDKAFAAVPADEAVAEVVPPDDLPDTNEKHSTLGMRMTADLPERITIEGVHIYDGDPKAASRFEKIIKDYPKLWVNDGCVDIPESQMMKVPLVEGWQNQKLAHRSYALSQRDRQVLDRVFGELHDQKRMEWVFEPTPFAHPVFVVWRTVRGEAKGRVVIDLRSLNKIAVPDNYPLPLQSEIIASLRGKKYITAVDATSFFYQFAVYPEHRDRFTLVSPRGLERSTVALMGFRNSPAYTQRFMDRLLSGHSEYCRAFIDDIVIYSETREEHERHLRRIFELFLSKNIAISPSKSFVGYPNVELLGFRVDGLGLSTTADRVKAFKILEFPNTLKALEQYIGMSGFLRHLIPYYAKIAEPLQQRKVALLAAGRKAGKVVTGNPAGRAAYCKRTEFTPTAAEMASFKAIQDIICSENPTILYHHDPGRTLFLQVDGSLERGFGVMLYHCKPEYKWEVGTLPPANVVQPVMFLSRSLSQAELRYGPSELEVACLVWAVKRLHTTVHSSNGPVIVLTDHSATKGIVEKVGLQTTSVDRANKHLINASVYLSQYNIKVFHLPGEKKFVPDALSRLRAIADVQPDQLPVLDDVWYTLSEAQMDPELKEDFVKAYKTDKKYDHIIGEIMRRPTSESTEDGGIIFRAGYPFVIADKLLYNVSADGSRTLCVPHAMIKTVLDLAHDEKHHFGRDRMLYDLRGLSIHNKTRQVKMYIRHCNSCNTCGTSNQPPNGDYQPIRPSDTLPMRVIAMDFITGLPAVPSIGTIWQMPGRAEFDSLLTVTDKATKRSLLIPGNERYAAEEWGIALMRHLLYCDWGIPHAIISDRDAKFTSSFWRGMWKALGTKLLMTTAYHPQADGMAERKNQTVELAIRHHLYEHPDAAWTDVITHLQWSLNTAYSDPIRSSPHELLFGFPLPGPLESVTKVGDTDPAEIPVLREHLRRDALLAMDFAAAEAKRQYDSKHKPVEFDVGQQVYLRLHHGYHLPGRASKKLSQQRSGPWTVKKRVGRLAYELDFLPSMRIHPVISVAHLTAAPDGVDPFNRRAPPPGPVEDSQSSSGDEQGDKYEVEAVVGHKKIKNGSFKYLIKWKGWDNHNNEWKSEWQLRHSAELIDEYWTRKGEPSPQLKPVKRPSRKIAPKPKDTRQSPIAAPSVAEGAPIDATAALVALSAPPSTEAIAMADQPPPEGAPGLVGSQRPSRRLVKP